MAMSVPLITTGPFVGNPRGYFHSMLADPAQHFKTRSDRDQGRSPSRKYKTHTIAELMTWPVADLAARHCWLFLWLSTVHTHKVEALMNAWGFQFSGTAFTWLKLRKRFEPRPGRAFTLADIHTGLGFTTRKNCEVCYLGRRGRPKRLSGGVREIIIAPIREHSRKPDDQYQRIEQFCDGPRIELFARQRVPGWHAFGNEVDRFLFEARDA
jgi:N6-adenosine-specific RNA methylase IME4